MPLGGKPLIDHVLDRLAAAGITHAVVNVHHLADQIEKHLARRKVPKITISDERDALLDTGGGVVRALPKLGTRTLPHSQFGFRMDRRLGLQPRPPDRSLERRDDG